MTITQYANPVNNLLNEFFNNIQYDSKPQSTFRPRFDIIEYEKEYKLYADLPGLGKKDITITVEDGILSISGEKQITKPEEERYSHYERHSGSFERRFNLPEEVDSGKVSAEMKNGELIVTIVKVEKQGPKKIEISVH